VNDFTARETKGTIDSVEMGLKPDFFSIVGHSEVGSKRRFEKLPIMAHNGLPYSPKTPRPPGIWNG